tara:strand:- start:293 stop:577 length:285 start_codon:yes stop_codon:yes gene_type:complete
MAQSAIAASLQSFKNCEKEWHSDFASRACADAEANRGTRPMRAVEDQARIDGLKQEIACLQRDLEASNIKLEKFRRELSTLRWDLYDEKKRCLG